MHRIVSAREQKLAIWRAYAQDGVMWQSIEEWEETTKIAPNIFAFF